MRPRSGVTWVIRAPKRSACARDSGTLRTNTSWFAGTRTCPPKKKNRGWRESWRWDRFDVGTSLRASALLSTSAPPGVGGKLQSAACWLVAALTLAAYAVMLRRYAVDFPTADDFCTILRAPVEFARALTLREQLTKLTELVEAHRFVTLRLAGLTEAQLLGRIDFRILMYVGSALLLIAGGLL